jgi:hypothetical protein
MKIVAGLTFPKDGFPAFLCIVKSGIKTNIETFKNPEELIRITDEVEAITIGQIFNKLKDFTGLTHIYTEINSKNHSYINEFRNWKFSAGSQITLRTSTTSSFEAGILTIKDMLTEGRLVFCDNSKVKSQLQTFSKLSLKNESEFYAVAAFTHIMGVFKKPHLQSDGVAKKPQSWY